MLRARWALCVALVGIGAYATFTTYRIYGFYSYVKTGQALMSAGVFELDADLGFAPRRGSTGEMLLPLETTVPVAYDQDRLRIPALKAESSAAPVAILALGDSVTHGDACTAEESFPYLVGRALRGRGLNAGFPAYGLAQMLLRGRELIPKYRPPYVVVEYGPWLVTRALSEFAPTSFGARPQPFFSATARGEVRIESPVFAAAGFGYPTTEYRPTPTGIGDFGSFARRVGVPLFVWDDVHIVAMRLGQLLGQVPRPSVNREEVVRQVYAELRALSAASGSRMIVVVVGLPRDQPVGDEVAFIKELDGVIVVEAWRTLLERLPDRERGTFMRTYAHYRGDPPILIDPHPNPRAHAIIAEAIVSAIRDKASSGTP